MKTGTCPNCGHQWAPQGKRKPAGDTVNPYGHPFPHARLYNVRLTPRLIGPQSWSPPMVSDDDPRNWSRHGGKPPEIEEAAEAIAA